MATFLDSLPVIGGAVQSVSGLIDSGLNYKIAKDNLNFQQQQFEYNKQLNDLQMEREDTAYQRAVDDARKAGLSALSVNSGASSSAGTPLSSAPQNTYYSDLSNKVNNTMSMINNLQELSIQRKKADAEIANINASTALSTQQLAHLDRANPITRSIMQAQLNNLLADEISKTNQNSLFDINKQLLEYQRDNNYFNLLDKKNISSYYSKFGINSSMTPAERFASIANSGFGKSYNFYENLGQFSKSNDEATSAYMANVIANNPISLISVLGQPILEYLGLDFEDLLSGSAGKVRNSLKFKSSHNSAANNGGSSW